MWLVKADRAAAPTRLSSLLLLRRKAGFLGPWRQVPRVSKESRHENST